jgi:hypothetical protein
MGGGKELSPASLEHVDDEQKDHGADDCHDERAHQAVRVDAEKAE